MCLKQFLAIFHFSVFTHNFAWTHMRTVPQSFIKPFAIVHFSSAILVPLHVLYSFHSFPFPSHFRLTWCNVHRRFSLWHPSWCRHLAWFDCFSCSSIYLSLLFDAIHLILFIFTVGKLSQLLRLGSFDAQTLVQVSPFSLLILVCFFHHLIQVSSLLVIRL
jgi:hypothetical protein